MSRILDIKAAVPAAGYPPLAAFTCPVTAGLRGSYFMGNGLSLAHRNWARGGSDGVIVGSPLERDGYLTFTGPDGYLQTDVPETIEQTLLVIARRPVDGSVSYIGNYGGGTVYGVTLYSSPGAAALMNSTSLRDTGAGGIGVAGTVTDWGLYVLTVPAVGRTRIDDATEDKANLAATGTRVVSGPGPYRVGWAYTPSFAGQCGIAQAAIWDRALSDAERVQVIAWARSYAAGRGLIV